VRIAVCAPALAFRSRSRSVAAVLDVVVRAAECAPAPELIVLPDCYAALSHQTGVRVSAAMCTGFVETLARAAKEWGVWIAFGHPVHAGALQSGATLLDPDGDAFLRFPAKVRRPPADAAAVSPDSWVVRDTPLGRWALRTSRTLAAEPSFAVDGAGLAIIPAAPEATRLSLELLTDAARRAGCAVCIAQARTIGRESAGNVVDSSPTSGAIITAAGSVLASTDTADIVHAELEISPSPAAGHLEELESVE